MADLRNKLSRKRHHEDTKLPKATPDLLREYRQWKFARSLVSVFSKFGDGEMYYSEEKNLAEARNMLDRWLLSFQLDYAKSMDTRYPLFPQSLCATDYVNEKLMDECIEKRFSSSLRNARKIFDVLNQRLQGFLESKHPNDAEKAARTDVNLIMGDIDKDEASVKMRKFESKSCWRVNFLVKNFGLLPVSRMLMRYEALGTGSLQWGDPITVHNALHDMMGVRYEGFASPLNSKMIDKEDSRFCSLFIDTDEHFGSMGSFFKVDFSKCAGGWTVNPPFIEELMDRVAKKILDYLESGGSSNWYFVTFPRWTDTPGWERLSKSELCIDQIELDDGRFTVQDSYGRVFPPRNNLTIFVMGRSLPKGSSLQEIKDTFKNLDTESVKQEWRQTCRTVLEPVRRAKKAPPGALDATAAAAAVLHPASIITPDSTPVSAPADAVFPAPEAAPDEGSHVTSPLPAAPIVVPPNPLARNRQLKRFAQKPAPESSLDPGLGDAGKPDGEASFEAPDAKRQKLVEAPDVAPDAKKRKLVEAPDVAPDAKKRKLIEAPDVAPEETVSKSAPAEGKQQLTPTADEASPAADEASPAADEASPAAGGQSAADEASPAASLSSSPQKRKLAEAPEEQEDAASESTPAKRKKPLTARKAKKN